MIFFFQMVNVNNSFARTSYRDNCFAVGTKEDFTALRAFEGFIYQ